MKHSGFRDICNLISTLDDTFIGGDEGTHLEKVRKYYNIKLEELSSVYHREVDVNYGEIASELNIMFDICQVWNNVADKIEEKDAQKEQANDLVTIIRKSGLPNQIEYQTVADLIRNLDAVTQFLLKDYTKDIGMLLNVLCGVSYKVNLLKEQNPE